MIRSVAPNLTNAGKYTLGWMLQRLEDLNDKIHDLLIPVHFFSTWLLVYDQVASQSDHVVHKLEDLI